jgi:hypothetical protein
MEADDADDFDVDDGDDDDGSGGFIFQDLDCGDRDDYMTLVL